MNLRPIYAALAGSYGQAGICLSPALVQSLADAFAPSLGMQRLELSLAAPGVLRVRGQLPNSWLNFVGSLVLSALADGIDIRIVQSTASSNANAASPSASTWRVSIDTNRLAGKPALQQLVNQLNKAAGVDLARIDGDESLGLVSVRVFLAIDALLALATLVPLAGRHIEQISINVNESVLYFGLAWRHPGVASGITPTLPPSQGPPMNTQPFEALLSAQLATRFADLKGSWANLHLELPESLLNDAAQSALASQFSPWLALVESANVKGNLSVDVKLKA